MALVISRFTFVFFNQTETCIYITVLAPTSSARVSMLYALTYLKLKLVSYSLQVLHPGRCQQRQFDVHTRPEELILDTLLEVLPYDPVCPSVGGSVCYNFLKGREITLPCSFNKAN